jgi:hypothetical protein
MTRVGVLMDVRVGYGWRAEMRDSNSRGRAARVLTFQLAASERDMHRAAVVLDLPPDRATPIPRYPATLHCPRRTTAELQQ